MRWVCQNNLGSADDVEAIGRACAEQGHEFVPIKVIPFSDEIPGVSQDEPTVFYGAVRWISKIYESGKWEPGVFFNEHFDYIECRDAYGGCFLNSDCEQTTLAELASGKKRGYYFVRPVADDKSFSGGVVHMDSISDWAEKLMTDFDDILHEPIVVSYPKIISREWRLFMVDGNAVTGSLYRKEGRLFKSKDVPREVVDFAEAITAWRFEPHRVFVLDVCTCNGVDELKVLETGCFNSAGFYDSDIAAIVRAVSDV